MEDRTPLMRPAEAAAYLAVSTRTLRRYLAAGALRAHRLPSGQVRIPEAALDELLAGGARGGPRRTSPLAPAVPARAVTCLPRRDRAGAPPRAACRRGRPLFDTSPEALATLRAIDGAAA
jgi:excisionase family DNA binding protein